MGRRVFTKTAKRVIALGLVSALFLSSFGYSDVRADEESNGSSESTYKADEFISERISNNYSKVSAKYKFQAYKGEDITVHTAEQVIATEGADTTTNTRDYSGTKEVLDLEIKDEVSDELCDKCGRNMVIKLGRFGKFLACPGFPE